MMRETGERRAVRHPVHHDPALGDGRELRALRQRKGGEEDEKKDPDQQQLLTDGGRLVVPVGSRETQVLWVAERRGDRTRVSELRGACFVPLIGRRGWEDDPR